jgi:hypothetical protein
MCSGTFPGARVCLSKARGKVPEQMLPLLWMSLLPASGARGESRAKRAPLSPARLPFYSRGTSRHLPATVP